MKILRNKKSIIITFAVIVGLIVVGIVVNNLNKKVEGYDKYSSTISIVTVSESGENHRIIEYETESDIIKIQANFLDMDTYYKENKLLFINADEKMDIQNRRNTAAVIWIILWRNNSEQSVLFWRYCVFCFGAAFMVKRNSRDALSGNRRNHIRYCRRNSDNSYAGY